MADTLTPEEKKRLTEELTKYANEGASDDDLRQFRDAFISQLKKKGGTQPVSGQLVQQPGQPSAPSFGQKITEKIATSATQIPLKTTLQKEQEESKMAGEIVSGFAKGVQQKEQERKQAYEQGGYAYEQFKQKEEAKKQVVAKAKEEESKNKKASEFKGYVREKDVFQMPTPGESQNYSYDFTKTYIDYLSQSDPDRADFVRDKYFTLKAKDKAERDSEDEKFLRQIESEALDITYRAKSQELDLTIAAIDKLQKKATPSDKGALDYLYKQYESTKNSLKGITAAYDQNKLQYGKIAGSELQAEEEKLARFRELQEGGAAPVATEFFKGIGNAVTNGVINLYQIPKVMGDLVGDTDYDWADQMYDSVSGAKRELDKDFGTPLPQGMKMSDLPTTARLAVVGGNAIGSVGLFATGGAIGGTTRLGQAAATFGTSFLTTESDYYQEALDAGMSAQDAAFSATYLAAQTALVESIIPDVKYFQPSAFRKSVIQGLSSGVRAGLPIKEAAKMAFKNTMQAIPQSAGSLAKAGTKEAGEEILGQAAEDVGKEVINASAQKEYFNDTFNPEAYTDAILGGFIAGGGLSVFSRPNSKSPTQQEVMREIVDRRDLLTRPGTASDKIAGKEDLRDFNEATEVFDAMSSHSAWKDMPREKQNQAFALAQQAELMKKEQERMKKLRIPDEQKDAEIKRLEDEVNMMFAEQLEQQKQAIYDQENIQGVPGQVGVGQELVTTEPVEGAGQETPEAGGVLQTQEEVTPTTEAAPVSDAETNAQKIETLRAKEQSELAKAIPNIESYKVNGKIDKGLMTAKDLAKYSEIYNRYDKLITPLLPTTEAAPEVKTEPAKPTRKERLAGLFKEEEKPAEKPVEKPSKAPAKPFSGIKNLFKKGFGGKRVSERESMSLIKELNTLIDRAEKENGVQRDSLKHATWKTNDGYTITEFFENKRGGTRITTPDGEEINIYDNKYKSETGKEISYFPEAGKPAVTPEAEKPVIAQAEGKPIEEVKPSEEKVEKPKTKLEEKKALDQSVNELINKKNRYNKIAKRRKPLAGNLLNEIKDEAERLGFALSPALGGNIKLVSKKDGKVVARRSVDRGFNKERNEKVKAAKGMASDFTFGLRGSILLYFLNGGKISTTSSELGKGSNELIAAKKAGIVSDTGTSADMIAKEALPEMGAVVFDELDAIAEIQDVVASFENKAQMEDELVDMLDKLNRDMEEAAKYDSESQMRAAIRNNELTELDEDQLNEYYESLSEDEKVKTIEDYEKFYQETEREQREQGGQGGVGIGPSKGTTQEAQEQKITYGPNEGLTRTDTAAGPFVSESGNAPYSEPGGVRGEDIRSGGVGNTVKAVWNKYKQIKFNGSTKVKDADDVAHIMRKLEDKSVEHAFAVHVTKRGKAHIQFLGMGGPTSTIVDPRLILAGVKKFKSAKVYLVHNHPSGSLAASSEDVRLTDRVEKILSQLGIELEHVIMDTYKKQYVHLLPDGISEVLRRNVNKESLAEYNKMLKTEIMDEQRILSQPVKDITNSSDVAEFLMQTRFTALPKHGMLLLNSRNQIIGNYIFKKGFNYDEAVSFYAESATGTNVILYSNQNDYTGGARPLMNLFKAATINVLDYVLVNSDSEGVKGYYTSFADSDRLNETQAKYGTNSIPNELREPTPRTNAEVQGLMEDAADAVEAAIGSGTEAQKAVNDIVGSQDWYIELSPKLKQQFNEILQDEFGATPKAQPKAKVPAAKPATKGGTDIQNIVDNYYKLKDGDRSARAAINEILDTDPKLKYIYNNISKINKQLQEAGVITDKTDGCP